jgi:hypothetical protein
MILLILIILYAIQILVLCVDLGIDIPVFIHKKIEILWFVIPGAMYIKPFLFLSLTIKKNWSNLK